MTKYWYRLPVRYGAAAEWEEFEGIACDAYEVAEQVAQTDFDYDPQDWSELAIDVREGDDGAVVPIVVMGEAQMHFYSRDRETAPKEVEPK